MRRIIAAGTAVAVLGVALAATWLAATSSAPAAAEATTSKTVHVTADLAVASHLDLGPAGPSEGDEFVFSGRLLTTGATPKSFGRIQGVCVVTRHRPGSMPSNYSQCSWTAVFPGGQVTGSGEQRGVPTPAPFVNAVTGGTSNYRTAHGQVEGTFTSPTTIDLVFRLLL